MFGITDFTSYVIGSIIIVLLPGPNSIYCLSVAASHGVRKGYRAVAGVFVGDSILILLTVVGVGGLLKLYPMLFNAVKMLGGLYLIYLGVKLFIGAYHTFLSRDLLNKTTPKISVPAPNQNFFNRALLLSITNPKAILFFLSFFVQFVEPTYAYPLLSFFILAAILQIISFSYLSLMVFAGKRLTRSFKNHPITIAASMILVGCLFIGFAINLWLAQLS